MIQKDLKISDTELPTRKGNIDKFSSIKTKDL